MRRWLVIPVLMFVGTGLLFSQSPDYRKADSVANLYRNHQLTDVYGLTHQLTQNLPTEKEKFRAIYRWVCDNIRSDWQMMEIFKTRRRELTGTSRFEEWNHSFYQQMVRHLLDRRETICTGYGWLVQQMARYADLPCVIVNGYGRSSTANATGTPIANHTWNAIQLDGKWYLCDATWSSGHFDTSTGLFVTNFMEEYFLPDPDLFSLNHFPLDTAWLLTSVPLSLDEFMQRPLIYGGFLRHNFRLLHPASFMEKVRRGEKAIFRIAGVESKLTEVRIAMGRGSNLTLLKDSGQLNGRQLSFFPTFRKRGTYTIHLLLGEDFLVSYQIIVM